MFSLGQRAKGQAIERQAERFLRQQGLKPVTRNYQIRGGEIDLIMLHGEVLVFIEVRYRKHSDYGSGAESVTASKQQRLRRTAEHYLLQNHPSTPDCRFDVVSASGDPIEFEWLQNAF
ncbi:YraN family protein [Bacterioplanes sanyensis]|uniref:UPF0102 protein CHH28_17910 n=1 Tax=Bacterioplanes sanyensis TaxID=1249553 RepID=A0A222FN30_9GAMM|nr:YraN family protein [Bacterioplanes sanyensis]ASP40435.1 YraN family protein [Bacterioplanes sanyensis]